MVLKFLADIVDWASRAGTLPMQGVMLLGIICIGFAMVYVYKAAEKKITALHEENRKMLVEFQDRVQRKEDAISEERKNRINMLIDVIREDTRTKAELKAAIDNNTATIERFEQFLTRVLGSKIKLAV